MKTLIKTLFCLLLVTQICFAQWVQTGPYGGWINCLAVSETNLFAGTNGNGVYFSSNKGTNWTAINFALPVNMYVSDLVVCGTKLFAGGENGVSLSTDNGTNWATVNSGLTSTSVSALATCPDITGRTHTFASTQDGIFYTTNDGSSWTKIWTNDTSGFLSFLAPHRLVIISNETIGMNLFAGRSWGGGLLRLAKSDTNWVVDTVITNLSVFCLFVDGINIFAGTGNGVMLSTDNGVSWVTQNMDIPSNPPIYAIQVNGPNIFASTSGGRIYFSNNYGTNWTLANSGLDPYSSPFITDFALIDSTLFAGTFEGIFISIDNGVDWTKVNTGISGSRIYDIAAIPSSVNQYNFIASTGDDVYLSSDNGTSWAEVDRFSDFAIFSFIVCPNETGGNNLFAGGNGVFLSTDTGISWKSTGLTDTRVFCFARNGSNIFAGTESRGVFLSTNNGTSWSPVNTGLKIDAVQFLYLNGINLFAGTNSSLFLSTNNGGKWTEIIKGLPKDQYEFFAIRDLVARGPELFLGTSHGVFYSTDDGNNWVEINSELKNEDVMALAISPDGENLFAGTYGKGIFFSSNNGIKWTDINSGLTNLNITKLYIDPEGKNLFAGTGQAGLWYRPLLEIVPVELTSFTATTNGKEVTLSWSTVTELNNQGFEVQRKFESNDFVTVGSVKGHGTTTSLNQYSFVDKLIDGGKYFYRLKQIDYDGTFEYSNKIEVEVRVLDKFTLEQNYPNPFNPSTTIGYVLQEKSNAKLTLLNALGEEIEVLVNEEQEKGYHKVEFNGSKLTSGVYFYQLRARNFIDTKKMILLR